MYQKYVKCIKAIIRGNFIALNTYLEKKTKINDTYINIKNLEK